MARSTNNTTGPSMRIGTAVVLVIMAAVVGVLGFQAATAPLSEHIAGWVVGPCDAPPSATVEVRADGELLTTGAVGTYNLVGRLCRATISVNDLDSHERYELASGELAGTVARSALHDMVTIRLGKVGQ